MEKRRYKRVTSNNEEATMSYRFIILGNPPSVNHLYGNRVCGKRVIRYMTKEGKEYKEFIKKHCTLEKPFNDCALFVKLYVYFGDMRRRDIDNTLKALLDGMNGVVFEDDSQVYRLYIQKGYDKSLPRTEVELEIINTAEFQ